MAPRNHGSPTHRAALAVAWLLPLATASTGRELISAYFSISKTRAPRHLISIARASLSYGSTHAQLDPLWGRFPAQLGPVPSTAPAFVGHLGGCG